jgi:hypothetical protein
MPIHLRPARSPETVVFGVATAIGLLHGFDDALLHRQPGLAAGQHALAAVLALLLGAAAIIVFPVLRPALRSATACSSGRSRRSTACCTSSRRPAWVSAAAIARASPPPAPGSC